MPTLIAYPNRFDSAAVSGPGWTTGMPLSYLLTRQLSQSARTLARAAKFYASFSAAKEAGAIALANHSMSTTGQWRVRGFAADPRPTVDLDFTQGSVPSGFTSTRGSSGTYFGSDGLLKTAASSEVRITYDQATRVCLGVLDEASSTNALTYARDGTNAAWSKTFIPSPALSATGIDGAANTATTLPATGTNARISHTHSVGGTPYVFSVWLKRISGTGTIRISADNFTTTSTVTLTSEWQRFEISSSSGAGVVGIQIDTSGDTIAMDYAQCELGSVATSPILTTSSTVTRSSDSFSYGGSLSGLTATAGALVMAGRLLRRPTGTTGIASIGFTTPSVSLSFESDGDLNAVYSNSGTQCSISTGALANGADFGCAFTWAANDYRFAVNGAQGTADTSGTVGSTAAATLGLSAGSQLACIVKSIKVYPAAKVNADLNSLASATDSEHAADYDSGWLDAWPAAWLAATTEEDRLNVPGLALHMLPAAQTRAHWRFDMSDPSSALGYLDLGRVFLGSVWTPARGMASGASPGYIDRAGVTEAADGAEYFDDQRNPRIVDFDLTGQTREAAVRKGLGMQRLLGTTGELLYIWDTDPLYLPEWSFLARLHELRRPVAIRRDHWTVRAVCKELL